MKLLQSGWALALIATLLSLGTTTVLVIPELSKLTPPTVVAQEKLVLPAKLWSFKTDAMDELIKDLTTERAKLAEDEKRAIAMQNRAAAERSELDKKKAEIQAIRDEIDQRVVEIQESEVKNLKTLAQTYSAMNPSAAVAILRELDEDTAVKILSTMKVDRVGPILGEMAKTADRPGEDSMPKRAARITDKLRLLKTAKKETT